MVSTNHSSPGHYQVPLPVGHVVAQVGGVTRDQQVQLQYNTIQYNTIHNTIQIERDIKNKEYLRFKINKCHFLVRPGSHRRSS